MQCGKYFSKPILDLFQIIDSLNQFEKRVFVNRKDLSTFFGLRRERRMALYAAHISRAESSHHALGYCFFFLSLFIIIEPQKMNFFTVLLL